MTDPVRWREDPQAPAAVRQLLAAAPPPTPLADSLRDRAALRLRAAPARGVARSWLRRLLERRARDVVPAGASTATAASVAVKAALALVVAGVAAGIAGRFVAAPSRQAEPAAPSHAQPAVPLRSSDSRSQTSSEPSEMRAAQPAEMNAVQPPAQHELPSVPPGQARALGARTPAPSSRSTLRPPSAERLAPQPAPGVSDPLLEEARSLKAIRHLDDPEQRLRALQLHARQFPSGALLSERRVLEIQTRLALGERADAERIARDLQAQDPDAFRAYRVDRWLTGSEPAPSVQAPSGR